MAARFRGDQHQKQVLVALHRPACGHLGPKDCPRKGSTSILQVGRHPKQKVLQPHSRFGEKEGPQFDGWDEVVASCPSVSVAFELDGLCLGRV